MTEVRATERGYYGSKIREPGEVFTVAEGDKSKWYEPVHPLDHDADGRKGGAAPAVDGDGKPEPSERDKLKAEATELKIEFAANIRTDKLKELVEAKKAESAEPAGDGLTDEDKILKAMEISGRTDEMTVEEADAILKAAAESNDI